VLRPRRLGSRLPSIWPPAAPPPGAAWRNFQIKFQQYDNYGITTDGRGYDNIAINTAGRLSQFDLAAGDKVTVGLVSLSGGAVDFALVDSGGMTAKASRDQPTSQGDQNFAAPGAGSYYLRCRVGEYRRA
jgi:hypothetical protein